MVTYLMRMSERDKCLSLIVQLNDDASFVLHVQEMLVNELNCQILCSQSHTCKTEL